MNQTNQDENTYTKKKKEKKKEEGKEGRKDIYKSEESRLLKHDITQTFYRFSVISTKIPMPFFIETEKSILRFAYNTKRS